MTIHVVKRGETLSSIAKLYSTTVDRLASENGIQNKNQISAGASLKIPALRQYNAPEASLKPADESKNTTTASTFDFSQRIGDVFYQQFGIQHGILDALLQRLRTVEANESVHHAENTTLTKQTQPVKPLKKAPSSKHSQSDQSLDTVKAKIKEQLGKEPHVVTFNGVKLTENEKKQIMASVAVCEMGKEGFGSINTDQEFVGKKLGRKGIETSYSRIVHIGLSYGLIQCTQDSGSLGKLLIALKNKSPKKFNDIFGDKDPAIAQSLIILCTTGLPGEENNSKIPLSGQIYWGSIKNSREGKRRSALANNDNNHDDKPDLPKEEEIRGRRVQPIRARKNDSPTDIWTGVWKQRFIAAGQVTDFQEAQIEFAVKNYMNPVIDMAKTNNLRSAKGLAFLVACAVRFGASSNDGTNLIFDVAQELGLSIPFKKASDEISAITAIAESKPSSKTQNKIGNLNFDNDEQRRADLLLKDDLEFLSEDLYDTSTY